MLTALLVKLVRIAEMLVGIGALIFVHELGHFLVAKRLGVKILCFSLGFGPRLIGFKKGETEYQLSLIPVGGYVKMHGEDPREPGAGDERSFLAQPPGKKVMIALAGPFMNVLIALLFFAIVFSVGIHFTKGAVGYVYPDSPADKAGLKEGDHILEIDGRRDPDFDDILILVALSSPTEGVRMKLLREGVPLERTVHTEYDSKLGRQVAGFQVPLSLTLTRVEPASAAAEAGLQAGDRIVALGGESINGWTQVYDLINSAVGQPLPLTVERNGKLENLEITPAPVYRYDAGLRSGAPPVVLEVVPLTPADRGGLQEGDRILSIDGELIRNWSQLSAITSRSTDKSLTMVVDRNGQQTALSVTPRRAPGDWRARMGITQPQPVVGEVIPDSPANQAGIQPGDRIVALTWTTEGQTQQLECSSWGLVEELVQLQQDNPITFEIDRAGTRVSITLEPERTEEVLTAEIGVRRQTAQELKKYGLAQATVMGFRKAVLLARSTYLTLRRILITRSVSARKSLGGPVLIFASSYRAAELGVVRFLYWLGMLGVWFAVFNLLPVPILDGGHIAVAAVEKVKGSPLSERTLTLVQMTGLVLIVALMIFVTINDILRLVGN